MPQIKADEITKIIREQIENFDRSVTVAEVGSVISVGDGVARIHGRQPGCAAALLVWAGSGRAQKILCGRICSGIRRCILLRIADRPATLDQICRLDLVGCRSHLRRLQNANVHAASETL